MTKPNDKVKVIAFTGAARSGKDTAAGAVYQHIIDHTDAVEEFTDSYAIGIEAFAGPIKSMTAMLLDFFQLGNITEPTTLQPFIDGDRREETLDQIGVSTRVLLQTLGTEWGRELINEDIWVNCMTERLKAYQQAVDHGYQGAIVCVTDLRFDNEAKALKEAGAIIVNIDRPDAPEIAEHKSEAGVSPDLVDITIHNDSDLESFATKVRDVLADHLPTVPEQYELPWTEPAANDSFVTEDARD